MSVIYSSMLLESDTLNKVSSNQLINSPAMCKVNKWKHKMQKYNRIEILFQTHV